MQSKTAPYGKRTTTTIRPWREYWFPCTSRISWRDQDWMTGISQACSVTYRSRTENSIENPTTPQQSIAGQERCRETHASLHASSPRRTRAPCSRPGRNANHHHCPESVRRSALFHLGWNRYRARRRGQWKFDSSHSVDFSQRPWPGFQFRPELRRTLLDHGHASSASIWAFSELEHCTRKLPYRCLDGPGLANEPKLPEPDKHHSIMWIAAVYGRAFPQPLHLSGPDGRQESSCRTERKWHL